MAVVHLIWSRRFLRESITVLILCICSFPRLLIAELFIFQVGGLSHWVLVLYSQNLCTRWITSSQWTHDCWTAKKCLRFDSLSFPWLKYISTYICRHLNCQYIEIDLTSSKMTELMLQTFSLHNSKNKILLAERGQMILLYASGTSDVGSSG